MGSQGSLPAASHLRRTACSRLLVHELVHIGVLAHGLVVRAPLFTMEEGLLLCAAEGQQPTTALRIPAISSLIFIGVLRNSYFAVGAPLFQTERSAAFTTPRWVRRHIGKACAGVPKRRVLPSGSRTARSCSVFGARCWDPWTRGLGAGLGLRALPRFKLPTVEYQSAGYRR